MKLALLVLLPVAAHAQLSLITFDGTTSTSVGATYNFGSVTQGTSTSTRFRILNTGTASIAITTLTLSGLGFTMIGAPSGQPVIAPANFLEFTVQFTAPTQTAATFSANLQVNTIGVILLATETPGPALTILFPSTCTANASGTAISFGSLQNNALHLCNFSVSNPNPQPLAISKLAVTGGFQATGIPALPLTLAPNQAVTFVAQVTPACGTTSITGAIVINTQTFALTATAFDPLLPKPAISFDASTFASAQQHSVSMNLPSAAVCAASGYLNLAFTSSVNSVTDDASIVFLNGSTRSVAFSIAANQTAISIGGQSSAMFQTGTTAGAITFSTAQVQFSGDPSTKITVPPAPVSIELATASNQTTGQLNIAVTGFDNTYSAGAMTFSFFDTSGKAIGSPITADFTSQFATYFSTQHSGSPFLMRVSFPVQGSGTPVGTVQATLTNAAGQAQTGTLTFQ